MQIKLFDRRDELCFDTSLNFQSQEELRKTHSGKLRVHCLWKDRIAPRFSLQQINKIKILPHQKIRLEDQ